MFDYYVGRSAASADHKMGIAEDMGPSRLMFRYSSKFTPEQFKIFDGHFRPRNEAFEKLNLQSRDRTRWNYQRYIKNYLRCVKAVDENVGRMLKFLDDSNLAKNTVVIYSSDQGFWLGEHGWFDKRWMYEESLHTPLLVNGEETRAACCAALRVPPGDSCRYPHSRFRLSADPQRFLQSTAMPHHFWPQTACG